MVKKSQSTARRVKKTSSITGKPGARGKAGSSVTRGKKTTKKAVAKSSPRKKTSSRSSSPNKAPGLEPVRLNKYLADCGVCSRRKADEYIDEGLVKVNGKTVYELGQKVLPGEDAVTYRGKSVRPVKQLKYFAFYKPKSVVTSTVDPQGRPTVLDYFKKHKMRLFPVGRLDWDSEGLLLVTNDGDFAQEVIHPRKNVVKTYHVKLDGIPEPRHLEKLKKGVSIIGGKVAAVHVKRLPKNSDKKAWIEIGILEGKNHQVKKMFAKIGFDTVKLRRVAIGKLKLSGLKVGEVRELTSKDLLRIFE